MERKSLPARAIELLVYVAEAVWRFQSQGDLCKQCKQAVCHGG